MTVKQDGSNSDSNTNSDLGWVGVDRNQKDVVELREYLKKNTGIEGLETHSPDEIERIKQVFYRDGFVVVSRRAHTRAVETASSRC